MIYAFINSYVIVMNKSLNSIDSSVPIFNYFNSFTNNTFTKMYNYHILILFTFIDGEVLNVFFHTSLYFVQFNDDYYITSSGYCSLYFIVNLRW